MTFRMLMILQLDAFGDDDFDEDDYDDYDDDEEDGEDEEDGDGEDNEITVCLFCVCLLFQEEEANYQFTYVCSAQPLSYLFLVRPFPLHDSHIVQSLVFCCVLY